MTDFEIRPRAPFDFDATARFFRFSEAEIVDTFAPGEYARALRVGGRLALLTVRSVGTVARPALSVSLAPARGLSPPVEAEAADTVRRMFSVDHDLKRFRAQVAGDALMSRLEAAHRGLRLPRWPTLFEALAASILLQQIATTVAWTFKRRFVEQFGERIARGGREFHAFPRPERIARAGADELRALGMTGSKAVSIIEAARAVESGALDGAELDGADNETVVARLSQLRGVGRWTAEWVLMLHFGRTDVFAASDLFLRGAMAKYYNGGVAMREPEVRALARESFGGWGSYAALYLLAGLREGSVTLKPAAVLSSPAKAAAPRR